MYEPGKVLRAGGFDPGAGIVNYANTIDFNQGEPEVTVLSPMENQRLDLNLVLLPDGHVLAVGGRDAMNGEVLAAEWWDPHLEEWAELAEMSEPRDHHSVAVLLSDGTVFAGGSPGIERGEVFSPPYLFWGARPTVASIPAVVNYGVDFSIEIPSETSPVAPEDVERVTLVRPGAATHGFDQNQRFIELSFSQGQFPVDPDILIVTPPADTNVAPPGHYMLFVLSADGIPSKASFVQLVE